MSYFRKGPEMRINVWLAAIVALVGTGASAAGLNTLGDLKVEPTASGARVVISGDQAPTFTVFRLSAPDRLVVDLSGADASGIKGHHTGAGPVRGVVASQFSDDRATVGRVTLSLEGVQTYDVKADGKRVVIAVDGKGGKAAPAAAASVEPAAKPEPAAAQAATAPKRARENVVTARVDEREVKDPAKKVTGVRFSKDNLRIIADGQLARFEVIELTDPPRLALDLYGVNLSAKAPRVRSGLVKDVRVGEHDNKVRLVVDMKGEMPAYEARRTSNGLALQLSSNAVARKPEPQKSEDPVVAEIDGHKVDLGEAAPLVVKDQPQATPTRIVSIRQLNFHEDASGGRIELELDGETTWKIDRPDPRSAVLTLASATLPKKLERSLDTSDLDTPVKTISTFSVPGGAKQVRVVVASSEPIDQTVVKTRKGLAWRLTAQGVKTEQVAVNQRSAGFSQEASSYAEQGAPRAARYRGKKVSFEFKDIDIHNLLRVIAEVSKKNIVVADDVKGTVTIRLRNVPWDQALELILRSKGLGSEELGNIVRVAPLSTLQSEAQTRQEMRKAQQNSAPLSVRLIPVNYATAGDMQSRVKEVLSERGSVTVDTRTNVLIVRDLADHVSKAQALVRNLDTQTPQVLIESRIVEASTSFTRQIGIQWGGHAQFATTTGNPTGLVFPYNASVAGGSTAEGNAGTSDTPNFAVNLPAAVGTGNGGALGFIFGSAGGAAALNLRLSAMENQGSVKTISAPKVTTLDNNTAKISQGVSIPFSQVSANGVNTTFIEARLSLEVTPHITQDGSVLMAIKAENNQPDPSNTGANGQPSIQRKEANTQVLVKDGDTTVIGGIYVRRGATSENGVPFLSKIPVLGFFFKNSSESDSRQELLIFITPRIINRQQISSTL